MRTHAAVRRLLEADAGSRSPLVLAFEDLDQSTAESIDLLYYLASNLREVPVLFVCTVTNATSSRRIPDWGQGDFRHVQGGAGAAARTATWPSC